MSGTRQSLIDRGTRGLVCGSLATIITATLSWSILISTGSPRWPGSSPGPAPGAAPMTAAAILAPAQA